MTKRNLYFEIDDIFETSDGRIWRVCGVIHDDKIVYGYDNVSFKEIKFTFDDVVNKWSKEKQE